MPTDSFTGSDFHFSNSSFPSRKTKRNIHYLLNNETGKLKADGEEGFPGGATDLFQEGNAKGKEQLSGP